MSAPASARETSASDFGSGLTTSSTEGSFARVSAKTGFTAMAKRATRHLRFSMSIHRRAGGLDDGPPVGDLALDVLGHLLGRPTHHLAAFLGDGLADFRILQGLV